MVSNIFGNQLNSENGKTKRTNVFAARFFLAAALEIALAVFGQYQGSYNSSNSGKGAQLQSRTIGGVGGHRGGSVGGDLNQPLFPFTA